MLVLARPVEGPPPIERPPDVTDYIARWRLDETSGSTVSDATGTYPGTLIGAASTWIPGHVGGALDFTSNTTYVDFNSPILPDGNVNFSITMWCNAPTGGTAGVGRGADGYGSGWSLSFNVTPNNPLSLGVISNNQYWEVKGTTLYPPNTWVFVACARLINNWMKVYYNGALEGTASNPWNDLRGSTIGMGLMRINAAPQGPGIMDDVRIYNRPLSDTEIDNIYLATK